jgi:hypothetical protein
VQLDIRTEKQSKESVLKVLSNQRRRFAMHFLKQQDGRKVSVSELAEQVASWEYQKEVDQLTYQEKKRVRNALRQFHLDKMAEHGFVEFDSQRGTVRLTEQARGANIYLDSLTGRQIPWGVYYLGLSAVCAVCLFGHGIGIYPFTLVPPIMWGVFSVTTVFTSSVAHFYDNYYRMRLGAGDKPSEVEER